MKYIRSVGIVLFHLGLDPRRAYYSLVGVVPIGIRMFKVALQCFGGKGRAPLRFVPILSDGAMPAGSASGHYFHQDIWAAKKIYNKSPSEHVDIGSRIDGFVSHLLVFREVIVVDIRELESRVNGLTYIKLDVTQSPLPKPCESVSCLHALEHFGLGRYGDDADVNGWRRGLANISSSIKPGGKLYISVPIGAPRIELNAQHVFSPEEIIDEAGQLGLFLVSFSYVDDVGNFHEDIRKFPKDLYYGCGLYEFLKHAASH